MFELSPYILEPGSIVSFRTIQEDRGRFVSDSVTLEVGGS